VRWNDPFAIAARFGEWLLYRWASTYTLLALARLRGSLDYRLRGKSRRIRRQLVDYFGDELSRGQVEKICERNCQHLYQQRIAQVWYQRRDLAGVRFSIEGREHLDEALALGRGVLLLTSHVGYPRLVKHLLRGLHYDANMLGAAGDTSGASEASRLRHFVESRLLPLPRQGPEDNDLPIGVNVRPVLRALADNRIVIALSEGPFAASTVRLPFLGKQRTFGTGPVSVSLATGAPIIPAFVVDDEGRLDRPRLVLKAPLSIPENAGPASVEPILHSYVGILEETIHAYPHLFYWNRRKHFSPYDSPAGTESGEQQ
jgi:KDO2-lipid IV(A) lauroyltransferase